MARIMVVDDDEGVIRLIKRALLRHNHTVIAAQSGREAIALLQDERPDLIILDVLMPDVNGIQVCRFMRTHPRLASIPILFLTSREEIQDKIAGFEAGGDDYLTKPFHLDELALRVRALLRRAVSSRPPTGPLAMGTIRIDPASGQAQVRGISVSLTPIEFKLLYYMVSHAGEIVSSERLLRDVWNYAPRTGNFSLVRMHVLNLRRKIEEDPRHPQLIRTVPRHGYVLRPPSSQQAR